MSRWAMRRCSRSIQGECGKLSGFAPRSLGGRSLMASSKVAWAWPPVRRAIRCSRRDWFGSCGMESSAGLDALISLEGAAGDAEDNHHRGHEGTQGKAKSPLLPKSERSGHPLSAYYLSMPQRSQHKRLLMRSCRCARCRACGWFVEGAADGVAGED